MRAGEPLALAERCEKASGPDYDLSMEIYRLRVKHFGFVPNRNDICYPGYHFTADLNAAVTLIPDGWDQRFEEIGGEVNWKLQRAAIVVSSDAATPPLALTAVCLRALASSC